MAEGAFKPITRPFLRWAGSKRRLLPQLSMYWQPPRHRRYIEPFMGSAALFFALGPERALLGDINEDLVATFIAVKDHPRAVYNRLVALPRGRDSYRSIRSRDPRSMRELDRAARFIYLNRFCFNGLYRTNRAGRFNVPYSGSRTGDIPQWPVFRNASRLLRSARVRCEDFEMLLANARKGDLVYLDPPYAVGGRRVFQEYYGERCFGVPDLPRIAAAIERAVSRGADFVLSYDDCPEAAEFFAGWNMVRVPTQRFIAAGPQHRGAALEVVISNMARPASSPQTADAATSATRGAAQARGGSRHRMEAR